MPELSDFRLGGDVIGSDGIKAGTLVSVLVEEKGFDPQALVVKAEESLVGRAIEEEKLFVTDEVVIPITAVESATHDGVRLSIPASEVSRQAPYLSYRFKPLTLGEATLEEAEALGGAIGVPNVEQVANKPEGQLEIEGGENVMLGETGHRLGKVREVLYDKGEVIGVVIQPEGFFKKDVVLPIKFISRADDLALFADLNEEDIEKLQPFVDGG
ncbi:MAG: PRC-barrel domain-containing protein [Candidatus Dormiibacterota bacterium]